MKVTEVTSTLHRVTRQRAIRNGRYTYAQSGTVITRVRTDDGIEGVGWAGGQPGADEVVFTRRWRWVTTLSAWTSLTSASLGAYVPAQALRPSESRQSRHGGDRHRHVGRTGKNGGLAGNQAARRLCRRVPTYLAGGYYLEGKAARAAAGDARRSPPGHTISR